MDIEAIGVEIRRDPFVPLRIHLNNGRKLNVRFSTAAVLLKHGLMVFKGIRKEGSHVATGYEQIPYENIARIEHRFGRGRSQRRKKAS
jgi:hypothetical protein